MAALVASLIGAVGSALFLLRATSRNPSPLLVALLTAWVVSPFVALIWANVVSRKWSVPTRAALHGVALVTVLSSLAVYGVDALWSRSSQGAFVFIVVPPASWLFGATLVALVSFGRQRTR
jgi:hypothetical protein